jgi:hypothetical protein
MMNLVENYPDPPEEEKVICFCTDVLPCGIKMPEELGGYRCNLPQEHFGGHVACGEIHIIARWK